jgi:TonB family protein
VAYRGLKSAYPLIIMLSILAACVDTPRSPKLSNPKDFSNDWYPPASRRLGEEGRVLVEFHLGPRWRPQDVTILQSDPAGRLSEGARKVVVGALRVDTSERIKPMRKYRLTVIFCLQPGNCDNFAAFPGTESVIVKGTPIERLPNGSHLF